MPGRSAGIVPLRNRAIATLGVYFSRKIWRGVPVSPLIDTVTRQPRIEEVSVAVSARIALLPMR